MKTKRTFFHWFFFFVNLKHIFCCNRFKVKFVRCIVVCRNCFWVTVYDDCFISQFFKLHCCVTTTVVEFNSLTDSVWTATQNHNLLRGIKDLGGGSLPLAPKPTAFPLPLLAGTPRNAPMNGKLLRNFFYPAQSNPSVEYFYFSLIIVLISL